MAQAPHGPHPAQPRRQDGAAASSGHRARRRPAPSTADLASVLGAVDAGILTVGSAGRIRSQNEQASGILGRRFDQLDDVFGPLSRLTTTSGAEPGPGPPGPLRECSELHLLSRPDRWLEVTRYRPPSDDAIEAIVIRDVTDARRSRGLREAFLGMLSHELRTPVTSIYAAADLLRASSGTLDASDRAGLLDDIAEEAERLIRLVDDLLILARYDEGVDLIKEPSLLQRVVSVVVDRERKRRIEVEIELRIESDLPVVVGDETSVQQVVRNLISNAVKYGGGGPVIVELDASDDARGANLRVLDRGLGISPQEAAGLFKPFYRSDRTARTTNGAGVGLYVCRRLVEAMGGHIWARPRDGGGSEFGFWLPEYAHDQDGMTAQRDGAVPVSWGHRQTIKVRPGGVPHVD